MTPIDYRSTATSTRIASGAAATIVALTGFYSTIAVFLTVTAAATLATSIVRRSKPGVTTSVVLFWTGIAVAAVADLPTLFTGVAFVASVVVWDSANRGIRLGHQLTHTADTRDIERLHAGATTVVGLASFALAYTMYTITPWPLPLTTVLAFVAAVFGLWYLLSRTEPLDD